MHLRLMNLKQLTVYKYYINKCWKICVKIYSMHLNTLNTCIKVLFIKIKIQSLYWMYDFLSWWIYDNIYILQDIKIYDNLLCTHTHIQQVHRAFFKFFILQQLYTYHIRYR